MRVLSLSYCFPSSVKPTWGVFVLQRLAALTQYVDLQVVAPVPIFPFWTRIRDGLPQARDTVSGLVVHRPRFFYLPGVMKHLDGPLYAAGLKTFVLDLCEQYQPRLLDAHFEWPDGVGVARLARAVGLPYTITLRGWLYEAMRSPKILTQCVEAMHGAARVISVSRQLAATARALGLPNDRLVIIPNGVDTGRFLPQDKLEARRRLGLSTDGRLIVTVAHLGLRKGHREMITAMQDLPKDTHLIIVGDDPQGRGRNKETLFRLIRGLGLDNRVALVGRQPYESIPLYLNAADVTVLASYREGCPNVVLESLACGTPVVATDVGAVPDLIQPGKNGQIVPVGRVKDLAYAVEHTLATRWSAASIRQSDAVRSWDVVASHVACTLTSAVSVAEPQGEP